MATTRTRAAREAGKLPDLSTKKLATYLYDRLRLPRQTDRKTGSTTTKEVVGRRLMLRYPDQIGEVGRLVLEHRKIRKTMEFLDEGKLDPDGRLRCTYKFTTIMGRLASSESPKGTGRNHQNIQRSVRDVFIPEDGRLFMEVDASQAEDRVVKVLAYGVTGRQDLLDRARAMPWENDEHKRAAAIIFKVTVDAVTKEQRFLGKKTRHAGNYDEGGQTHADNVLKESGIVLTIDEAQAMIDAIHAADPDIRVWQQATRALILRDRCLANSWGRILAFDHARLDHDTNRQGYAFIPQSEVADLLNQRGLVPLWHWLRQQRMQSRITVQAHDALLMNVVPEEAWAIWQFLKASMERPRHYNGVSLVIPVEVKLGRTWAGDWEAKKPPTRDEFEAALTTLLRR